MKLLSGIYTADEGEFFLNGAPLHVTGPKQAQEQGISIIHQEFNLMPDLTVAQNIYIGKEPRTRGVFLQERRLNVQARDLIERLHLPLDPKQVVGNLTVAKQQMVEIAKALAYDAKILIMDEPTAALNDAEVSVLHGLIRRFVRRTPGHLHLPPDERAEGDLGPVTVIRDGRYVDTVDTQARPCARSSRSWSGRELSVEARPVGVEPDREVLLSVEGLRTKRC
jgi:ribose transport system ATP-binding protein